MIGAGSICGCSVRIVSGLASVAAVGQRVRLAVADQPSFSWSLMATSASGALPQLGRNTAAAPFRSWRELGVATAGAGRAAAGADELSAHTAHEVLGAGGARQSGRGSAEKAPACLLARSKTSRRLFVARDSSTNQNPQKRNRQATMSSWYSDAGVKSGRLQGEGDGVFISMLRSQIFPSILVVPMVL